MFTKRLTSKSRKRTGARSGAVATVAVLAALALASGALAADELTIRVSPTRAHALPGGEVVFVASAYDSEGELVPADVVWSVIPPRVGVIGR